MEADSERNMSTSDLFGWRSWETLLGMWVKQDSERDGNEYRGVCCRLLGHSPAERCWEAAWNTSQGWETPLTPTVSGCAYYQSSSFLYFNLPWCSIIMTSNQKKSSGNMSWKFAGVIGSLYSLYSQIDAQKDKHMTLTNTIHSTLLSSFGDN